MESLIPIVAITSAIGIPAAVIIIGMFVAHKNKIARYNVVQKAIESNATPEVIEQLVASIGGENSKKKTPPRQRNLIHGTILLALGIALFSMRFFMSSPDDIAGVSITGMVLTLLAAAKFIIAFFIVKKDPEQA
ncbi:MAG: hypothetical protein KAH54_00530 [Candidatus Sabulitectum sp.]|nr:hypothetical protein [Candidatus Sabulitectum sp.]